VRIAVLADLHRNFPALRAVLEDVDQESVEVIVVAGDVVGGPYPREVLERLADRRERVVWVRGSADREAAAAWDVGPVADDEAWRAAAWSAQALERGGETSWRRGPSRGRCGWSLLLSRLPAPR
jgi:predicted phosphodiesterase